MVVASDTKLNNLGNCCKTLSRNARGLLFIFKGGNKMKKENVELVTGAKSKEKILEILGIEK